VRHSSSRMGSRTAESPQSPRRNTPGNSTLKRRVR
jgi:hypothetical protein